MPDPELMTCQELVELITEYLEGSLGIDDRARFEEHLPRCRGCADYLEQMRQTIRASGQLREDSLDADTRDQLLTLFADWKHARRARAEPDKSGCNAGYPRDTEHA
jgi:anti-sigma factor RsiW